jgi:hypothetical protein
MLDHLVDLLGWKQPSVPALMPGLTATPPTRPLPARTRRRRRRILGRRKRRVPRTPVQPPLKLGHPSLESLVRLDQLPHPQQQRDSCLAIAIKDRLRLCPLHHRRIRRTDAGPSRGGERLLISVQADLQMLQCAVDMEPFMELSGSGSAVDRRQT